MPPTAHAEPPTLPEGVLPEPLHEPIDEIALEKTVLRKMLRARRAEAAALDRENYLTSGPALSGAYHDAIPFPPRGTVISAYVPMKDEISPETLLADFENVGADHFDLHFCLPRTPPKGSGLPLSFHLFEPGKLVKSAFGVLEPPPEAPVIEPDILLVPLLGFDRRGYRLGYGAGHYDRTLAVLRARRPILAVGLAWACQEVERIPVDAFDQPLDWVVTEHEAIRPIGR